MGSGKVTLMTCGMHFTQGPAVPGHGNWRVENWVFGRADRACKWRRFQVHLRNTKQKGNTSRRALSHCVAGLLLAPSWCVCLQALILAYPCARAHATRACCQSGHSLASMAISANASANGSKSTRNMLASMDMCQICFRPLGISIIIKFFIDAHPERGRQVVDDTPSDHSFDAVFATPVPQMARRQLRPSSGFCKNLRRSPAGAHCCVSYPLSVLALWQAKQESFRRGCHGFP